MTNEIENLENQIAHLTKTYDEINEIRVSLTLKFALFWTMIGKKNFLTFDDISKAAKNLKIHERLSVSEEIKVIAFLHVNPCSSVSGERLFSIARRVKSWLRSIVTTGEFNSVLILRSQNVKTKNLVLLAIADNFICNDDRRQNFGRHASNDLRA